MATLMLIDLKKAFKSVDHTVAVMQLYHLGCRLSVLEFMADFLTGRPHRMSYCSAFEL